MSLAYAALWIFVFSMPWENLIVIPGFGAISRLMGMLALGVTMLAVVVTGRLRRWQAVHIAGLLFVIWVGACLLVFYKEPKLPTKFYTYAQLFLVLWIIWELAVTRRRLLGLLAAYVFGACVAAVNTIMLFRTQADAARRFSAEGFDPNDLAMRLALGLPMAWYLGMTSRQPILRWLCRAYVPVGLFALILTASRGGMVAAMVGLLIVPLTMTKLSPGKLAAAIFLIGVSGAVLVQYAPQTVIERLATTHSQVADGGTLGGRVTIWRAGMEAFLKRPIIGHGAGSFGPVIRPILGYTRTSHNSYLGVLVEQGIIGFGLYMAMFVAVFLALLELPLLERRFGLVLLATLAIAMLPLGWEDRKPVWFVLAVLLGLSRAWIAGTVGTAWKPGWRRAAPTPEPRITVRARPPLTAPVRNAGPDAPR